MDLHFSDII